MAFSKILWFSSTVILFLSFTVQLARVGCEVEDNYTEVSDNCTILTTLENFSPIRISSSLPPHLEDCDIIIYEIHAKSNSSILKITGSPYSININPSSTPSYPDETETTASEDTTNVINTDATPTPSHHNEFEAAASEDATKNILITFEELTFFKDGTNGSVTMETWKFTYQNYTVERIYLSRSSYLRVLVNVMGNWTREMVELSFKEIEFSVFNMTSSKKKSGVTIDVFGDLVNYRNYRPNSVYIFQIQKSRDMNVSSVFMTLDYLDLDVGVGEYLLIGSGDTPFQGPPPLFLSTVSTQRKKYQINDENAYIVFVATSTRKRHHGFKVRWEHKGTKIAVEDDKIEVKEDDILQSIQVCIYNSSAALDEFKKSREDQFVEFRKGLSVIGSEIAINNTLPEISYSQISFYRISAIESSDKNHPEGLLYVMLKIVGSEKGRAAFNRTLLQKSFDLYYSSQEVNQYSIGACPKRKPISPAFYAILPIFCCFLMLVWIWKQRPFSEYFMRRRKGNESVPHARMSRADERHFYSNQHIPSPSPSPTRNPRHQTIPKVGIVYADGRRQTLVNSDSGANLNEDPERGYTRSQGMIELNSTLTRNGNVISVENPVFDSFGEDCSSEKQSIQDMVTRRETENVSNPATLTIPGNRNRIYDTRL